MPTPFFFMEAASFLPLAFFAVLPRAFLVALRASFVPFVIVVRVFFTVGFVAFVFVVVVIAMK